MPQVIVVGAGPAGSAAATVLAHAGIDVLLIDKATFPRDKACGDAVTGNSSAELGRLGVLEAVRGAHFHPIRAARYVAPSGSSIEFPFPKAECQNHFIAPRTIFDHLLQAHAVSQGARYMLGRVVAPIVEQGRVGGVIVETMSGREEIRAPITIAGDGANSVIARTLHRNRYPDQHTAVAVRAYIKTTTEQSCTIQAYFLRGLLPGYAWIFPSGRYEVNVGLGMRADFFKRTRQNLTRALEQFLSMPHIASQLGNASLGRDRSSWFLNLGAHSLPRTFPGAILIGDAGGFINPITGSGIDSGLTSGRLAGETAARALERGDAIDRELTRFDALCRPLFYRKFAAAFWLQGACLTRADSIDALFRLAQLHPLVLKSVVALLGKIW